MAVILVSFSPRMNHVSCGNRFRRRRPLREEALRHAGSRGHELGLAQSLMTDPQKVNRSALPINEHYLATRLPLLVPVDPSSCIVD